MECSYVAGLVSRMDIKRSKQTSMHTSKRILYITYDGLLDPLGASQILPYVYGLYKNSRKIHILSFEKLSRYKKDHINLRAQLNNKNISWSPLIFSSNNGLISKTKDLVKMYFYCWLILTKNRFDIIHARGHTAAEVGVFMKNFYQLKVLFDLRGLWVDERVDKGSWDLARPIDYFQYQYFKMIEKNTLRRCDQLVVLTNAVVQEVQRLASISRSKITVIPCCADYDHFYYSTKEYKNRTRNQLNIDSKELVIGYLGSIGSMYRIDSYLYLLNSLRIKGRKVKGLVITKDINKFNRIMEGDEFIELKSMVIAKSASRKEVPLLLSALDVLIAFTNPSYSKVAMSPTKLGESFASGKPVICNDGVGDIKEMIKTLKAGLLIPNLDKESIDIAADKIDQVIAMGGADLRDKSRELLSLEKGLKLYERVYETLEKE